MKNWLKSFVLALALTCIGVLIFGFVLAASAGIIKLLEDTNILIIVTTALVVLFGVLIVRIKQNYLD